MKRAVALLALFVVACSGTSPSSRGTTGSTAIVDAATSPATSSADGSSATVGPAGGGNGATTPPPSADASSAFGGGGGGTSASDGSSPSNACTPVTCGSVTGFVQRTSTVPTHGGIGNVYVAIFIGNPITGSSTAKSVGTALLKDQDMSSATAQVAYEIDDVPIQSAAYQAIAFLDDSNSVSTSDPAPASGDLVSLDTNGAFSGYPVTVSNSSPVALNLPLNTAMP